MHPVTPDFYCRFSEVAGIPVILAFGEVDVSTAPVFRDALLSRVTGEDPACLIVDLRRVTFMDSEGLRVLLGLRFFCPDGIALVGVPLMLRQVLAVTETESLFLIAATSKEAASQLKRH